MEVHVLNGDALAQKFPLEGKVIIAREALIDGPVKAESFDEFWKLRATYHEGEFPQGGSSYSVDVKNEFGKLLQLKSVSSINLWFEHDLFCQVNMWFTTYFLHKNNINSPLYRVMPPAMMEDVWSGFGKMGAIELLDCYKNRVKLTTDEIALGVDLWNAYSENQVNTLQELSSKFRAGFPLLNQAVHAHIQRLPLHGSRPHERLKQILQSGYQDFNEIFTEFSRTEGVYGFGDLQVKNMLAEL